MTDERITVSGGWLAGSSTLFDAAQFTRLPDYAFDASRWPRCDGKAGAGRGSAFFVADACGDYVLRNYQRGGLVARLSRDRYVATGASRSRPFREWRLLAALAARGLPVPVPVAACYRRRGLLYTAALLTRRLADTRTLAAWLAEVPLPAATWHELGALLQRFHAHGACHADLNAHNILRGSDGALYVLDFDRGRLRRPGRWCSANLARLRRSLDKLLARDPGFHFGNEDWASLQRGYQSSSARPA